MTSMNASPPSLAGLLDGAELPSFPAAIVGALRTVRDPASGAEEVAEAVLRDPGTVVRILRTVNSAAFGSRRPIQNVAHAVSYMGRGPLETVILTLAVRDAVPSRPAPGFESRRFWAAAAQRAALARLLAARLHPATQTECFTLGLLQDMAVPVLAHSRAIDYRPVLEEWHRAPGTDLATLERSAFGWCHGQVGDLLARTWELPASLAASIGDHHGERPGRLEPAVHLVRHLRETAPDAGLEALVEEAREVYGLEPDWVVEAAIEACDQAVELADLLA